VVAVYSHLLAELVLATGTTSLGGPDGPVKWIVKDMVVVYEGEEAHPRRGFAVKDSAGAYLMYVDSPFSLQGVDYHWTGSQVVETTDSLTFTAIDISVWTIRVSGYILDLP
jgi:hypothetical protein